MSVQDTKAKPQPPDPVIHPTGNASLDVLAGDLNQTIAPFQSLSQPDATPLDKANAVIGGVMGAMQVGQTLLNDGFAMATAGIAKFFPPLPAATLGMLHLGFPHTHTHPPSFIPPAPPVPLPSLGPVLLSGCASVLINGVPAARAGDLGISLLCGTFAPPFEVFTGSSSVFIGGARAARMLDITKHCQPGEAAAKAGSLIQKVGSAVAKHGMGVIGMGAEVLGVVTTEDDARRKGNESAEEAADAKAKQEAAAAKAEQEPEAASEAQAAAEDAQSEADSDAEEAATGHAQAKMMAIQAGLDAAAMAMGMLMGMDPGVPPCYGAVLLGMPNVLIGGFPMPPWGAVAKGLEKLGKGLKRKKKPTGELDDGKRAGHPINPITGANEDGFIDYQEHEPLMFRWERNYTSADADRKGQLGRGFRHGHEHRLRIDLDQATYVNARGQKVVIPLPASPDDESCNNGIMLFVEDDGTTIAYELQRLGGPALRFYRDRRAGATPPVELSIDELRTGEIRTTYLYDSHGRLYGMDETDGTAALETRLTLDDRGNIIEVRRGPRGSRELPVVASYRYDHADRLVAFQDAAGASAHYAYDSTHRLVRMTDRNGYSFHFAYDEEGRCIEEHGDDGLWRVALRYEPERRRTVVTQADGGQWIYQYDEDHMLVCIHDPYGGQRRLVAEADGNITREIGADGETAWRFLYDAAGGNYGLLDRYGEFHPPLAVEPNPPLRSRRTPGTALDQQWGEVDRLPTRTTAFREALPAAVQAFIETLPSDDRAERGVTLRRDRLGRVIEEVDTRGQRRAWSYDANGNAVRYVDRDGRPHKARFTSWNLVGATIDPAGNATWIDYTAHERAARITDPGGAVSRYEYDLKDRLVRVVRHGVIREEYTYDVGDRLIEKRDATGEVLIRCKYGKDSLPLEYRLASGEVFRYAHDERGEVIRASTADVEVLRGFDARRRLVFDERDGRGVRHLYVGEYIASTTYLGRFIVRYHAASDGSWRIQTPVGGEHRIRREGNRVLVELRNGTSVLSFYDTSGRCLGRAVWRARGSKTALWSVRYTYSAEGELRRVDDSHAGITEYTYDAARRLISERAPDGVVLATVLDGAGNVREKANLPRTELAEGNRLLSAGRERFAYDKRNHLAEWVNEAGEMTRYHYNSIDMLVRVSCSGRDGAWAAAYDGIGRRLWKALGDEKTEYFWDGDRLAAERSPSGMLRLYVYARPGALVPLLFIDYPSADADPESGQVYFPIVNQVGVPLHIEDEAGRVVWRAQRVEPYGALVTRAGASVTYALRFPGHFFDEETGLHYNRFRYYSPRLGRYLQSDPKGQSGGINIYAYPPNPLADVDVLGLVHTQEEWTAFIDHGHPITEDTPNFDAYEAHYRQDIRYDAANVDADRRVLLETLEARSFVELNRRHERQQKQLRYHYGADRLAERKINEALANIDDNGTYRAITWDTAFGSVQITRKGMSGVDQHGNQLQQLITSTRQGDFQNSSSRHWDRYETWASVLSHHANSRGVAFDILRQMTSDGTNVPLTQQYTDDQRRAAAQLFATMSVSEEYRADGARKLGRATLRAIQNGHMTFRDAFSGDAPGFAPSLRPGGVAHVQGLFEGRRPRAPTESTVGNNLSDSEYEDEQEGML